MSTLKPQRPLAGPVHPRPRRFCSHAERFLPALKALRMKLAAEVEQEKAK